MRRRLPAYSEHESYAITDSSSGIQFGNDSSNKLALGHSAKFFLSLADHFVYLILRYLDQTANTLTIILILINTLIAHLLNGQILDYKLGFFLSLHAL